jgi:aspartyl protease family protein
VNSPPKRLWRSPPGGRTQRPGKAGSAAAAWRLHCVRWACLLGWLGCAAGATAQSVSLQGSLGASKALLLIDGQPQTLAVGASAKGVTLHRLGDGEAEVEVSGQRRTLRLGAAPSRLGGGGAAPGAGTAIVLPMGAGGHFSAAGSINGKQVNFLVDTGATSVALSQGEANRIGLDWKRGRPGLSHTANGTVPVYAVNLTSVRVGDVEIANVAGVVIPSDMPMVLLGNSFLNRFNMRRDNDVMRLEKKP